MSGKMEYDEAKVDENNVALGGASTETNHVHQDAVDLDPTHSASSAQRRFNYRNQTSSKTPSRASSANQHQKGKPLSETIIEDRR